jgi:hypothetical protein
MLAEQFALRIGGLLEGIHDEEFGSPSVSWGWSVVNSVAEEYNEAFRKADEQMYIRKKAYKHAHPFTLSGTLPTRAEFALHEEWTEGFLPTAEQVEEQEHK